MADLPSKAWDPSADGAHGHMEWPAIPGYQIESRVGAGGMAVVFRHGKREEIPSVHFRSVLPARHRRPFQDHFL